MPRNSNGVYTLPAGNPVISGTIISSGWANPTMGDLANEITDSLSRSGEGGMLESLMLVQGSNGMPGLSWTAEITTGFYLAASQDVRMAMGGRDVAIFNGALPGMIMPMARVDSAMTGPILTNNAPLEVWQANGTFKLKIAATDILAVAPGGASQLGIQNTPNSITVIGDSSSGVGTYARLATDIKLIQQGTPVLQTIDPVFGSVQVLNTVTGTGMERVLTTSDLPGGSGDDNEFPGPNPTLTNSVAAIIIGTDTPDIMPHIAAGPTLIQAKANGTTAADLTLQALGGGTRISTSGYPHVELQYPGYLKLISASTTPLSNYLTFTRPAGGADLGFMGYGGNTTFAVTNLDTGPIALSVNNATAVAIKGAQIEPSLAIAANTLSIPGIRTPAVRIGSTTFTDAATQTSTGHAAQVGDSSLLNLRMSSQRICTSAVGFGGALYIQDGPSQVCRIGSYSSSGNYLETDGTVVTISKDNQQVLRSATPANGGILVNGLHGMERVLTASDSAAPITRYSNTQVIVVGNDAFLPITALTLPLAANSKYIINVQVPVTFTSENVFEYAYIRLNANSDDVFACFGEAKYGVNREYPDTGYLDFFSSCSASGTFQSFITSVYIVETQLTTADFMFVINGTIKTGPQPSNLTVNLFTNIPTPVTNPLIAQPGAYSSAQLIP